MNGPKITTVRKLFDELGKGEPASACCNDTVFQDFSTCTNCGKLVSMPFYFVSTKPLPDELAIAKETMLRALVPKGAALVCLVPVP